MSLGHPRFGPSRSTLTCGVLRGREVGADYRWCRSTKSCLHEKDRPSVEIARFPLDARHVTDGGTWPVYVEANGDVKAGSNIEILRSPLAKRTRLATAYGLIRS